MTGGDLRAVPLILCIETATKLCSVALGRDGQLLAHRDLESEKHVHAEKVNVFIEEVTREAGVAWKDLEAVAVGIGPGSYTGLRIGTSAAKGLCYALDIPIIGISTLDTLVASAERSGSELGGHLWPMIDARRMEVFTRRTTRHEASDIQATPVLLDADWIATHAPATVFGDGADKAATLWESAPGIVHLAGIRPLASAMLAIAEERFKAGAFDDLAYLVPDYGKAANITQPRKRPAV